VISQILEPTTTKRMKIVPYCRWQNCIAPKCTFQRCIDYFDIAGRFSARVYNHALLSRAYLCIS